MLRRIILVLAPLLALSGCDVPPGDGEPVPPATPDVPGTALPTPDAPDTGDDESAGGARDVSVVTESFLFDFSYPQEAGELPALAAWLDQRMERRRQTMEREANRGRAEARENGFPFNKYSSGTSWEVVADLPGWLSLSAALSSYQGGAHPNYGFDTIVWDKEGERPLEPIAFFTSAEALDDALGERLCDALNGEREKRRGAPVEAGSTDSFDSCITPDETNLLLGSSNGRTFNRIGIQIAPYLAGPYAEGSYEFTFNMDEDLLAIVRPEYREAFSVRN